MTRWARAAVALSSVLAASAAGANECAALAAVRLPKIRLVAVERIEAGPDVPAHCRVQGEAQPTSDSHIGFEVWLPERDWNGRYYQLGSGGFAGSIHQPSLAAELRRGNAVAATDTGHRSDSADAAWALGHPEKIVDYGHRSIRETAHAAKALVREYYRKPARYSYFVGCSNGGRQALMAAQRFPEDWDGILAGAPALAWTRQLATFAWMHHAFPDSTSKLQLTLAEQFFRNMVHDDPQWTIERFAGVRDLELAQQRRIGKMTLSQVLDAVDPDLSAFERLRGKLLMYFGWADALISPQVGVDYYQRVVARMGSVERTHKFFRLFMVPGMGHCQGGTAPHAFGQAGIVPGMRDDAEHDMRRALEDWVERGRAPERIVEEAQVLRPYEMGEQ